MGIRDLVRKISPPWLADGVAEKLLYSFGLLTDALLEKADQAAKAWMPGIGTPTTLSYLGSDRQIARGLFETDAAYAERLRTSFDAWVHAGSPWGVLWQTIAYFSPFALLAKYVKNGFNPITNFQRSSWDIFASGAVLTTAPAHSTVEPANWNWDGFFDDWFRRWLIFYPPNTLVRQDGTWDSPGTWDDGGCWDLEGLLPSQIDSMKAIAAKWKSRGTYLIWIIFSFDPTLFDETKPAGDASLPDGTWGDWHKTVGGVAVAARSANAVYISGGI